MKVMINADDKNYLANLDKFREELNEFLSKWGYVSPKTAQNFYYSTIDIVYQIDRANLEPNLEEFLDGVIENANH